MKASIHLSPVCFALAGMLLISCGKQNDERDTSASSMSSDSAESQAAVAVSFNEAIDAMSDSNLSNNTTALALGSVDAEFSIDRSCAVVDDTAQVTIDIDKQWSWERSGPRASIVASANIDNTLVRTWSKEGASVACMDNGKFAAINFEADITGYELDVTLNRSADRSLERTVLKTGEKATLSLSSTVEGSRHVEWKAQSTLENGSISRSKSISFSVNRNDNFIGKDGAVKDLQLAVATSEDLQVTVVWDTLSRNRQLLSKLIESGKIKATHAGQGSLEASFSNLLMKFDAASCSVYSGSMDAKIYAEGSTEAAKSYRLTAVEGTITVQDVTDSANPVDVDDFDYSPCDIKDFNN